MDVKQFRKGVDRWAVERIFELRHCDTEYERRRWGRQGKVSFQALAKEERVPLDMPRFRGAALFIEALRLKWTAMVHGDGKAESALSLWAQQQFLPEEMLGLGAASNTAM